MPLVDPSTFPPVPLGDEVTPTEPPDDDPDAPDDPDDDKPTRKGSKKS
jgi:hypothetical protein